MMSKTLDGDLGALKFELDNARKDVRYYTHLAEGLAIPTLVGEAVHQSLVPRERARPRQEVRPVSRRGTGTAHRREARSLKAALRKRRFARGSARLVGRGRRVRRASAIIFGVAYSFAAFFARSAAEFAADRADVSLVFGLSGLIYFLSAPAPDARRSLRATPGVRGGNDRHRRRPAREQLRAVDGGDLRRLGRRSRPRHRPRLRALDRHRAAVVRSPARVRGWHRQRRDRRRHAGAPARRDGGDRRARLAPRAAGPSPPAWPSSASARR
jgi:hypothetical protein